MYRQLQHISGENLQKSNLKPTLQRKRKIQSFPQSRFGTKQGLQVAIGLSVPIYQNLTKCLNQQIT